MPALYMLETVGAAAAAPDRTVEVEHFQRLRREGVLVRIWERICGRGHWLLLSCADAAEADARIGALPGFGRLRSIAATALVPHRLFPQFAQPRAASGRARGELYMVRLEIDRARLAAVDHEALLERAERNARRHVDEGTVIGIWRMIHGSGALIAWCARDNRALHEELRTLPAREVFGTVDAVPVVPAEGFENLAGWDPS